jgi:hypothetical protein
MYQVLVTHTCNPSYSGDIDQEDRGSKPTWANIHKTLSRTTLHKNRAGEGPVFKPQYHKKKKKKVLNVTVA